MSAPDVRRGLLLAVAFSFLIVIMDALVKLAAEAHPVIMVVWARYVIHLLITPLLGMQGGIAALLATRRLGLHALRSVFMLGATGFFFTALKYIPLADAIAIGFIGPFVMVGLSVPILGERVRPGVWIACVVGFGGALLIIRPGFGETNWAYLLPLAAALSGSLYGVLTRRLGAGERPATSLFYAALVGGLATSVVVPFEWQAPAPAGWLLLAGVGIVAAVAHLLLIQAYRHAPASLIAPLHYLDIVWGTGYGLLLWGDFPEPLTWAGVAVIIGSGLYVYRSGREGPA
jgi:drug/metabolite transporter (DMT)-like permease